MQRRKVYGIVIVLFAGVLMTAPAQNRSAVTDALEEEGYTALEEYFDGGVPSWRLRDDEGRRLSVSVMGRFSAVHAEALEAMQEVIHGIDGLEIDRLRYVFEPDRADAVVIPERFIIAGDDYVEYLPSGMQFEFDDAVRFDFRLLVDNLAVRMNGQFLSEAQFLDRIQRAVENPAAYIQSQDPQYLAQQIVDLRERLEERIAVDAEQNARDQQIVSRIESLADSREAALDAAVDEVERAVSRLQRVDNQLDRDVSQAVSRFERNVSQLDRDISRLERAMTQAEETIQERITVLTEQQTQRMREMAAAFEAQLLTLREEHAALEAEKAALEAEFEALRQGSIILAGRTLFGNLRDVAPEAVVHVVQLRATNPEISQEEILDQVNADLPEDAEPLHTSHVQAIYALYFNQYE